LSVSCVLIRARGPGHSCNSCSEGWEVGVNKILLISG